MAVLTINHKIDIVNNFITSVKNGKNSYYCFIAKADPWLDSSGNVDETAIVSADDSVEQVEQKIYRDLVYGKLLVEDDIAFMVPRYDWTPGTVYARYDNTDELLYTKPFFVITDTYEVYKCINNGYSPQNANGAPSTVKPSVNQTSGTFATPDGYIWKYMFTVDNSSYLKFQTANYIPVTPNNDVIASAVPGSIDNLVIVNGGSNFQIYEEGYLRQFVNNYVLQLPSTSNPLDNYYTDSSIYLKAGFGAGQLRKIASYGGLNKLLSVDTAFDLFENLKLSNINGSFDIGYLVTQRMTDMTFLYNTGFFNVGDVVIQSDTVAQGVLRQANATTFAIENLSNTDFSNAYPLYSTAFSGVQKSGKAYVDASTNGSIIHANGATAFTTDFAINGYIRLGENANTNIRRIASVNSTVITVTTPYAANVATTNVYSISTAVSVEGFSTHLSEGAIVYQNIESAQVTYSNNTPAQQNFIIGETVVLVDGANTAQGANGTVSFANTSTLILNNVLGTITSNLFLVGLSSQTKAHVDSNDSYPNITVSTILGGFESGMGITIRFANGVPVANAKIVSVYSSPNELTEYIISPAVDIEGDGNGAIAYSKVDLSSNNPSRSITDIVLIDGGHNYTSANVHVSANSLYGVGAIVEPQISPVAGHGSEPYVELGATFAGISKKFDTGQNEGYYFPLHGSYRTVGIIKNPTMNEAVFNVSGFDRTNLFVNNAVGAFQVGEIVVQPTSNAAGVVTAVNSTAVEIKNTVGTFVSNTINGWSSNATAHVIVANTKYFSLSSAVAALSEVVPGGTGEIDQILSNTQIRVTNVVGSFSVNDAIYEPSTNAYAKIDSIYTSNGTVDSSGTFGNRFNQTARIPLTANTRPYHLFEMIKQDVSNTSAQVISVADELDITYIADAAWTVGETLVNSTTGANAVIVGVDIGGKHLKLSGVSTSSFNEDTNRPFNPGDAIRDVGSTKSSTINTVTAVIVVNDVNGSFQEGTLDIVGANSGALGQAAVVNSIKRPDLTRNSGKVVYLETLSKFDRSPTSTEQLKLVVKF